MIKTSYSSFKDGYAKETTPGTSAITGVGDTAYLWGAMFDPAQHPSPKATVRFTGTGVNVKEVAASQLFKQRMSLEGFYGLVVQNGIPIWAAMGKSSTASSIHTITPTTDGTDLPSFTINHEQEGTATDEEYQFLGCKIDSLTLVHDMNDPNLLMAQMNWLAMKAQDGIALTTAPALPATANTDPYVNLTRTWDYGSGNVSLDGLKKVSIVIANGLNPLYAHSWDSGTYTGQWPWRLHEAKRKAYRIVLDMHPVTVERQLWDELISLTNTKELYFKWTRSTNDYIEVTATDCQVIEHELKTPKVDELLIEQVVLEPRALSFSVKDSIAGGLYGE